MDLRKAFDMVNHGRLLEKLPVYGIKDTERKRLISYLFARAQVASFKGTLSDRKTFTHGVPQDSTLGPLLFALPITDVHIEVTECKILLYADDTVVLGNFDPYSNTTTLSLRWKEWLRWHERFLVAMDIKDHSWKRTLLLSYSIFQRCLRLRQQVIICEFSNSENELKIQLVESSCLSLRVRRKAIQDDLSLANILAHARCSEITDKAVKTLEDDCGYLAPSSSAVNAIHNQQEKSSQYHKRANRQPHQSATQYPRYSYPLKNAGRENLHELQQNGKQLCYNCGGNYNAGHLSVCRAKGKSCFACGKQNYFATMCRSRQRNNISVKGENIQAINCTEKQSNFSDEDSYVFVVTPPVENEVSPNPRAVKTIPVIIERARVKMIVDTGKTTNILDSKAFNEIKKKNPSLNLQPSTHKMYAYMQYQPLPVFGNLKDLVKTKCGCYNIPCCKQGWWVITRLFHSNRAGYCENECACCGYPVYNPGQKSLGHLA
ncbi:RNA-directed DNA polymerase from mobile element jockey [Paramuricea clavata]|uniref:RNA-directed DNA polymerase from mobile element jockey n=1 Tax=Paramuricea clavata TaxID=317549 RepID=A0A7D9JU04_PARCT|nr:RNA-directed DNA polymerase from mobile element jockey [Paramuricea clavata]